MSFFDQKTVLVTGAAGFLGSHLSTKILESGARVFGIDNFISGNRENVTRLKDQFPEFIFVEADASTPPKTYLQTGVVPDIILHFASPASPDNYQLHPVETYSVNSFGTHFLLDFIKKHNPNAQFLFASTSEIYGDPTVHPQTESYWGNVNPNGVRSCYDESKRMGETICGIFGRDFGVDTRIVRVFNTYGPNMAFDGRVIPSFIKMGLTHSPYVIYGDPQKTRSYCYVDDLIDGILLFLTKPELAGETINIGNSSEFSIMQTVEVVHQALFDRQLVSNPTPELELRPDRLDDPSRRCPDTSKAEKLLGWQAKTSFAEGVQKTIDFVLENSV
jgi:nucleoside-diphosphate-sugar epimerase